MATSYEVVTPLRRYQVVNDVRLLFNVLAWGRVTDLTNGKAPRARAEAVTDLPHSIARTFDEGFWCVAGNPARCFEDLTLANTFTVTLSLAGYLNNTITVNVPALATWPVDAGTQAFRPLPIRLQGRVTATLTGLPIPNGTVRAVDPTGSPLSPRPFLLRSPLKQDRTGGSIRGVTLIAVVLAPPRELTENSIFGSADIVVNDRSGFSAGQVIRFRDERSGEFGQIKSVSNVPANLALPGIVTLETPVRKSFPRTTPIQLFTVGANIGISRTILQSARAGESVLQVNNYPSGDVLRVTQAGLFPEFHAAGALTDADGYYAIDGATAVGRIFLGVDAAGFLSPPKPELWIVDYAQAVNVMEFRLI